MLQLFAFILLTFFYKPAEEEYSERFIVILGIAQDGGYPQTGCVKECCARAFQDPSKRRFVTSFALADPLSKKWWLFEATPDLRDQLQLFREVAGHQYALLPVGIFLTHAHIGHYSGLMQFGKEVMNTKSLPVYAMPRMKNFLSGNGPWSQLVSFGNISIQELHSDSSVELEPGLTISPFLVPHRDEFSETVGFTILNNQFNITFIPDIDKWNTFDRNINDLIQQSNLALLDGTFYRDGELRDRSMKDIPHPFVEESMQRFKSLSSFDKKKIVFIHFNHTNPLLDETSDAYSEVMAAGYGIARQGDVIELK